MVRTDNSTTAGTHRVVLGISTTLDSQALSWLISTHREFEAVTQANDIDEIVAILRDEPRQIIILDEWYAVRFAPLLARQVSYRLGDSLLGVFADSLTTLQLEMVTPRARALFSRNDNSNSFLDQLDRLIAGEAVVSKHLSQRVSVDNRGRIHNLTSKVLSGLTDRQLDVLVRVAEGKSAKEVARELHISEKAVESHKYRIMKQLNMNDRIGLCRWAIREGLIMA